MLVVATFLGEQLVASRHRPRGANTCLFIYENSFLHEVCVPDERPWDSQLHSSVAGSAAVGQQRKRLGALDLIWNFMPEANLLGFSCTEDKVSGNLVLIRDITSYT